MAKHSSHILELARKGAEARLRELMDEARMLVQSFPHLRDSFDPDELPVSFIVAKGSGRVKREQPARVVRKRPRRMSAAQRKAVSRRMKAYWAKRKAGAKQKAR